MNVYVSDSLSCIKTIVHSDGEGLNAVPLRQRQPYVCHEVPDGVVFRGR